MILAIDVGNTHIVLGCLDGKEIRCVTRLSTDTGKTEYEYAAAFRDILSLCGIQPEAIEGAIISSVVSSLIRNLRAAVRILIGREALVVGAGIRTGLNIRIDDPAQLGSDLAVGAVAAKAEYPLPCIVIDMGTATTISALDAKGAFIGGAIVPGVGVSMNALSSGTSQLPYISIEAPKSCIGTNTIACMQSGAIFGAASMLDGMIERMEAEMGPCASIVATGGLSASVVPHCRREIRLDPDLLLKGLAIIWEKNQ